jgi:hypothetical protein
MKHYILAPWPIATGTKDQCDAMVEGLKAKGDERTLIVMSNENYIKCIKDATEQLKLESK